MKNYPQRWEACSYQALIGAKNLPIFPWLPLVSREMIIYRDDNVDVVWNVSGLTSDGLVTPAPHQTDNSRVILSPTPADTNV